MTTSSVTTSSTSNDGPARLGRRALLAQAAGSALVLLVPGLARAEPADVTAFIQELGDEVVRLLRAGELTGPNRQAALEELLGAATDVDLVGQLVLGPAWRGATAEQREEYLRLFRRYAMRNLTDRLSGYEYDGESFAISTTRAIDARDSMVTTEIRGPSQPPLKVDWRVRTRGGAHAIVDVVVEGISMVVSQRSEFQSVIGRSGLDGLLAQLRQQVEAGSA